MAAGPMESVAYRMVAPVGLDFSKVMAGQELGWDKMMAGLAADDAVMAAEPTEMHLALHRPTEQAILLCCPQIRRRL
jgi:thiamine monophosphate kinase